jgi:hypothetical protein
MSKWTQVFVSRKIWATIVAVALLGFLYANGDLDGEQLAQWVSVVIGILTGSIALEDGLSALLTRRLRKEKEDDFRRGNFQNSASGRE